jgi:hypothetical protein
MHYEIDEYSQEAPEDYSQSSPDEYSQETPDRDPAPPVRTRKKKMPDFEPIPAPVEKKKRDRKGESAKYRDKEKHKAYMRDYMANRRSQTP